MTIEAAGGEDRFTARIEGDVMARAYLDGDVVTFSRSEPIRNGEACLVEFTTGETLFRRVFREVNSAGYRVIRLSPINAAYKDQTFAPEVVTAMHKAM